MERSSRGHRDLHTRLRQNFKDQSYLKFSNINPRDLIIPYIDKDQAVGKEKNLCEGSRELKTRWEPGLLPALGFSGFVLFFSQRFLLSFLSIVNLQAREQDFVQVFAFFPCSVLGSTCTPGSININRLRKAIISVSLLEVCSAWVREIYVKRNN